MLSIDLYPIHHLDDHEFFPGDFIVRAEAADPRLYGVIQRMDHNGMIRKSGCKNGFITIQSRLVNITILNYLLQLVLRW